MGAYDEYSLPGFCFCPVDAVSLESGVSCNRTHWSFDEDLANPARVNPIPCVTAVLTAICLSEIELSVY
jgi:hypothetical protein